MHSWLIKSHRGSEIWYGILKEEEITCVWGNQEGHGGSNGRALKTWVKFSLVATGVSLLVSNNSRLGYLDHNPTENT